MFLSLLLRDQRILPVMHWRMNELWFLFPLPPEEPIGRPDLDLRLRPKFEVPTCVANVCLRGICGRDVLALSLTGCDPEADRRRSHDEFLAETQAPADDSGIIVTLMIAMKQTGMVKSTCSGPFRNVLPQGRVRTTTL